MEWITREEFEKTYTDDGTEIGVVGYWKYYDDDGTFIWEMVIYEPPFCELYTHILVLPKSPDVIPSVRENELVKLIKVLEKEIKALKQRIKRQSTQIENLSFK